MDSFVKGKHGRFKRIYILMISKGLCNLTVHMANSIPPWNSLLIKKVVKKEKMWGIKQNTS